MTTLPLNNERLCGRLLHGAGLGLLVLGGVLVWLGSISPLIQKSQAEAERRTAWSAGWAVRSP
jgi:hypothetical protein